MTFRTSGYGTGVLMALLGLLPRLLGGTRFDADRDPLLQDCATRSDLSILD